MAVVQVAASLVSAGTERMVVEFAEKSLVGKARLRPDLVNQILEKARREGVVPTLRATQNRLDQPMSLGYSSAGTIHSLGKNMQAFKIGQRVACAGGGYAVHAEYNLVPRNLLTPLPRNVNFESGAFATLGAIALHGLRLAQPQIGENVAVIGLGLLGLLTAQLASASGCNVLGVDIDPQLVRFASSLGIPAAARKNAESHAQALTSQRGVDAVIICADTPSTDPIELAGRIARDRGRVVATGAVGLTLPRKIYYEKELSFINSRSYGPGRYDTEYEEQGIDYPYGFVRWTEGRNFQAVVDLMADGKLNVAQLITHRIPIEKAPQAYEIITGKRQEPFLGVLITYPGVQKKEEGKLLFSSGPRRPAASVKLGVLGAGLYANATFLPVLHKGKDLELVGIASSTGVHAKLSGAKFGFKYATSSDEEILRDRGINAVAILTRHDSHADLAIRALKAGKHVFLEKPLAIDSRQLDRVIKAMKSSRTLLTVGFNRRFSPHARLLAKFLQDRVEPLHVHYRINAGYLPPTHWTQQEKIGGGRIIGEACHFVDLLTFLAGAAPISVTAHALSDGGKYREDNVSMTFTFPDGTVGVVDYLANGDRSFPKERVEVFCGGGIAVLDDFVSLQTIEDGRRKTYKMAQDKGWKNEISTYVNSIREGSEPQIPYEQLVGVTRATFAAVESLRNHRRVDI